MLEIDKVRGALLGEVCGDALGYPMKTLTTAKLFVVSVHLVFVP